MGRIISEEVTVIAPLPAKTARPKQESRVAHLIVMSGTNVGQVFELDRERVTLGRDDGVELQIMDAGISRRHATVSRDQSGKYFLEDAGSRNGTFANNVRVSGPYELQDGDKIQLGVQTILKFSCSDDQEASYAQAMYEAALRDGHTGLFNRRYFDERLRSEFAFAARHGTALALLLFDLDHFKRVNDAHGHMAGDHVLKEFSKLLLKNSRSEDVQARFGGEEFAILCRDTGLMSASVLGERVRHALASHVCEFGGQAIQLTVSTGIAALPDPGITSADALIRTADDALYQAKNRGRNCVVAGRSTG
jgi:two-component system, cell cycle response regulator